MAGYSHHILFIDTDETFRNRVIPILGEYGFFVSSAESYNSATEFLIYFRFNLIVFEYVEDEDIKFIKNLKNSLMYRIPIVTTGANNTKNKIKALENGSDDYLAKPFDAIELALRMKNFISLYEYIEKDKNIIRFGSATFNIKTRTLIKDHKEVTLTNTEINLLRLLIDANGVVSREKVAKVLEINPRSVDVQINRLRSKIEKDTKQPQFLQTIRNEGYILHLNF